MKKMCKKPFLILIFICFLFMFISIDNRIYVKSDSNLKNTSISTLMYQNLTYSFPSFESGQFYNTYTQYGQLHLLPFETLGGWQTSIYSTNDIYIYNIETICYNDLDISLLFYFDFGIGWMNTPSSLNNTFNNFLNGNWNWFFMFNFTTLITIPIIFNFTIYYLEDIIYESSPFLLTNSLFELLIVIILFLTLLFIYIKIKSLSLMTIVYLIFIIVSITFFFDLTVPFYPFLQLFFLSTGTFLFTEMMLGYQKQKRRK